MKHKIEKKFLYEGLGFPVYLINVPMIEVMGVWTPNINYNKLQKILLFSLAHKPFSLTGNEIRFVRKYFEKSMEEFGKNFGITHAAISKWEAEENSPIKTDINTEICIRLFILDNLEAKDEEFGRIYREFITSKEKKIKQNEITPIYLDAEKEDLIAI